MSGASESNSSDSTNTGPGPGENQMQQRSNTSTVTVPAKGAKPRRSTSYYDKDLERERGEYGGSPDYSMSSRTGEETQGSMSGDRSAS